MANTNTNVTYPYSDNYMTYNYQSHRYELTEKAVYDELGVNFKDFSDMETTDANPSTIGIRILKKVSRLVYSYLLENCQNAGWLVYELAVVQQLRSVILEMLLAQAEYQFTNGDISNFSGVDIYKGQTMEQYKLKEATIAPLVRTIAERIQPCLGRSLKFAGSFGYCQPPYTDDSGNTIY